MVDITRTGMTPGATKPAETSPVSDRQKQEGATVERREPVDRVEISEAALSRQEAEKAAADTRRMLEEGGYSLGIDPEKVAAL